VQQAQASMQSLQDQLNTSLDGQYLFAGINSDVKPMDDYYGDPPSAGAQAIKNAFVAKFGMSPDDPNVSSISASDMQDFLNNEFSNLFSDANWSANWSAASDKPVNSRISRTETADTSVTANDNTFRQLTQAFTMISGLGFQNLNSATQQVVMQQATQLVSNGIGSLTKVQSFLGVTQQRVSDSNDQIDTQIDFLNKSIDGLESVDTAAVTTKISDLSTALEAAYAVTNRLSNLSIMDYLTS
jgi:flagellar hook-associated protein 3 FlgL